MKNKLTLREWINAFDNNEFENSSKETQIYAGWYDWFCKDSSLKNKTKKMGQIIKQIKDNGLINLDETYVWFKNNCPLKGSLFDDFRITDLKDNSVIYTVSIDSPWEETKFTVYSRKNFFITPIFKTNKQKELVRWLNGELR